MKMSDDAKARLKQWRIDNPERHNESQRIRSRRWRLLHASDLPQRQRKWQTKYYKKHKKRIIAKQKRIYKLAKLAMQYGLDKLLTK